MVAKEIYQKGLEKMNSSPDTKLTLLALRNANEGAILDVLKSFDVSRKRNIIHRSSIMEQGSTYSMKFYLKFDEYKVHDFANLRKKDLNFAYDVLSYSSGVLRFEVTLRKKQLEYEFKKKRINFEYRTKYNHNDAVFRLYKYLQTRELKPLNMEKIEDYEFIPIEMCNNGALIEMNEEYKDQIIESYGSDYSSYYPNLLNSGLLYMPYKKGHLTIS